MTKNVTAAAILALAIGLAAPASAATLVANGSVARAAFPSAGEIAFEAGSGAGTVSFVLTGYNTVDGRDGIDGGVDYSDLFTVTLNGATLYSGYFRLGGIGSTAVVANNGGFSVARTGGDVFNIGGTVTFSGGSAALANGVNRLRFSYATPNAQAFGDESFGISSVVVTGNTPSAAVPEPSTWALMLVGFGLAGTGLRSRRRTVSYA
jgi:hypothetical protein